MDKDKKIIRKENKMVKILNEKKYIK